MLVPANQRLSSIIGADYFDTFRFWKDEKNNIPYDFTNWTQFTMLVGTISLTEGVGLVIDRPNGSISPSIARAVTAVQLPWSTAYALSGLDPNNKLGYLMIGKFDWLRS